MSTSTESETAATTDLHALEEALLRTAGIPIERRDVDAGGLRLHYLACGEGQPLVLLHGRGNAAALFAPILRQLAERRRVVALDMPGWGLSDKPPFTGHTPEDALRFWMDGVLAFLDSQGLAQVDILGHSLGGMTALGIALDQPDRIGRLALVDPAGLGRRIQLDVRLYFALGPEKLHRRFGKRFTRLAMRKGQAMADPAQFDFAHALLTQEAVIPSGARAFSKIVDLGGVHLDFVDRLSELEMPVLMLWGDRDQVIPYENGLAAMRLLRDGTLVALSRCGHSPYAERPDDFASVLLAWLDNLYVRPRI